MVDVRIKNKDGLTVCPQCGKQYKPDLDELDPARREPIQNIYPDSEPWQREQLITGLCSDKCFDEYLGVTGYTYKDGKRYQGKKRKLFP